MKGKKLLKKIKRRTLVILGFVAILVGSLAGIVDVNGWCLVGLGAILWMASV
jgi:hypothetical protein